MKRDVNRFDGSVWIEQIDRVGWRLTGNWRDVVQTHQAVHGTYQLTALVHVECAYSWPVLQRPNLWRQRLPITTE